MKQHITLEQIKEISQEQIISLFDDFERQAENFAPFGITEEEWYMHFAEQMNIGKMIELLAEKDMIHLESVFAKVSHGILSPDEILDALFEALKSVL